MNMYWQAKVSSAKSTNEQNSEQKKVDCCCACYIDISFFIWSYFHEPNMVHLHPAKQKVQMLFSHVQIMRFVQFWFCVCLCD